MARWDFALQHPASTRTGPARIVVDRLLGGCQAVIKPLGRLFEKLPGFSGSTILGSREVALILDVRQVLEMAASREGRAVSGRNLQQGGVLSCSPI